MIFNRLKNYLGLSSEPKSLVLMYHRVCNLDSDPWQLAVSPDNFETQIKTITDNYNVLPVSDLIEQFKNKRIKPNCVYITFDDTYQDNYFHAKPILEKYNCPATFFVPTYFIGKEQMFWWDELEKIILHSHELPNQLTLNIDDQYLIFQFQIEELTEEIQALQQAWYWSYSAPTRRCELYLEIWQVLKPLPYHKIMNVMTYIKKWAGFETPKVAENFPMNHEQLKDLSNNKLFSLGIHTHTHPALASHPFEIQLTEIENSKYLVDNKDYKTVNAIAYPYGNYNGDTLKCIEHNKIDLGFTTAENSMTRNSLPLEIPRVQIMNYDGATLNDKLMKCLNK